MSSTFSRLVDWAATFRMGIFLPPAARGVLPEEEAMAEVFAGLEGSWAGLVTQHEDNRLSHSKARSLSGQPALWMGHLSRNVSIV